MKLSEIRKKYYPNIDETTFVTIVAIDPTYRTDRPEKRGHYVTWLLSLFTNGNLKPEDYNKASRYLKAFDDHKRQIERNDISQYRTLPDLYESVEPFIESNGKALSRKDLSRSEIKRNGAEKVYEDDEWIIVVPKTFEASALYGSHTQWCTTGKQAHFDYYTSRGPLYININRKTGHKWQMHFIDKTRKFSVCCNERDAMVQPGTIGLSQGAIDFYDSNWDTVHHIAYYGKLERYATGIASENIFLRTDVDHAHPLIPGNLVGAPTPTGDHMTCRSSDGNYYYVAPDGTLVDTHGLKAVAHSRMCSGFVTQYDPQEGWYVVDSQSNLTMLPQYGSGKMKYNVCGPFVLGRALVRNHNGDKNYIDESGKLLFKDFFKDATAFRTNGMARVSHSDNMGSRCQFVDVLGSVLPGEYLKCNDFVLGVAAVRMPDGSWNFVTTSGELLLKRGVDYCSNFDRATGLAMIHTYRGDNYINVDGQLLYPDWGKPTAKRKRK